MDPFKIMNPFTKIEKGCRCFILTAIHVSNCQRAFFCLFNHLFNLIIDFGSNPQAPESQGIRISKYSNPETTICPFKLCSDAVRAPKLAPISLSNTFPLLLSITMTLMQQIIINYLDYFGKMPALCPFKCPALSWLTDTTLSLMTCITYERWL